MDKIRFLIIIAFGLILSFCESKRQVVNVDEKINEFIRDIDSIQLRALDNWYFTYRGPNGFWQNDSVNETRYNVRFSQEDGETILTVFGPQRFIQDFRIDLLYDTSIFNIRLVKVAGKVSIYKNWDQLIKKVEYSSLTNKDPFKFMSDLNELKDKYGFGHITHARKVGTFTEFYFSSSDLLTFIPDTADIRPQFKALWKKDWAKGKWINNHWNLRKLEKPKDFGG